MSDRPIWLRKKVVAAVVGVLVVVAGEFGLDLDPEQITQLVGVIIGFLIGQGIADNGKEAARVHVEAAERK